MIMSKEDDFERSVNEFRKVHQETCSYDENELWKEFTGFIISLNACMRGNVPCFS